MLLSPWKAGGDAGASPPLSALAGAPYSFLRNRKHNNTVLQNAYKRFSNLLWITRIKGGNSAPNRHMSRVLTLVHFKGAPRGPQGVEKVRDAQPRLVELVALPRTAILSKTSTRRRVPRLGVPS